MTKGKTSLTLARQSNTIIALKPKLQHPKEALKRQIRVLAGKHVHFYLLACPECGHRRWKYRSDWLKYGNVVCLRCSARKKISQVLNSKEGKLHRASGPKSHFFKRGWTRNESGYIICSLPLGHPFRKAANIYGSIRQHRLVMMEHLGRPLESWEQVHHKNGKRDDNRIENLELLSSGAHTLVTRMEVVIKELQVKNERLQCLIQQSQSAKAE